MLEDQLYKLINSYNKSPKFFRHLGGSIYKTIPLAWRYGETYTYYHNLLNISPYYSDDEKSDFIKTKLKNTLINAYENSEFYKKTFSEVNFSPYNFKHVDDILSLPFTDKEILRSNKDLIFNKNINKNRLLYVTTGGTSGVPVEVYFIKGRERSREYCFMTNQWKRIGYKEGDRIARIRGTVVDHKNNNTFFKYEPIRNRLYLSTFDLYEENFPKYIDKLHRFKPHFIHTYPSAIIVLAKYIKKNNISFEGLKGIFCSSEQFYPGQREIIEKAFNANVYSWYGHTESTTLAGECESSQNYHIFFEYGYTELIDENGEVITKPGVQGEIVGTSFEMTAFPIIRYKTGDYAEYVDGKCKCGRNYMLIKNVQGRWHQENLISKKNSKISLTALNMHSDLFDNVIQYQFHQIIKGEVFLKIIKSSNYTNNDEKKIQSSFEEKLKDHIDFKIKYVNEIPRTERGKHKFLIQEVVLN